MLAFRTIMPESLRRSVAFLLASALLWPGAGAALAQVPAAAPDLAGSWQGWARLSSEWNGNVCRYEAEPTAVGVRLELSGDAGLLRGSLAIDIPAVAGSGCPPLRKRYAIAEATQGTGTVGFTDSGGNEWSLALRRSASVLQGLMTWREGGPDEPLAEGFALADGKRPPARLSGEVRLERVAATKDESGSRSEPGPGSAPAGEGTANPRAKAGAGTALRHLGIVLGANIVGLGALYGVNRLGEGSAAGGAVTCSPRACIIGAPNAPCAYCEGLVVYNGSCGETEGGIQIGLPCDVAAGRPCAANLSCNNDGVVSKCEDQSGRCPW